MEEISKHCPLLPAQVENLQISGTVSSSDNWDSGFETCGISQGKLLIREHSEVISPLALHYERFRSSFSLPREDLRRVRRGLSRVIKDNSSNQRRVPLLNNNITNSPADGAFDEDSSNLGIQRTNRETELKSLCRRKFEADTKLLFSMQEDLEKTYQNYESSDNSIFGVPCEAVPDHSNVESEEAYHCAEQENSNSNVEAEEANYGAEQGNLIQKIGPSSGPVEGGGNFLITVSEELPDCIDSGFAYFGSNHAVLTKLNKFTFEGRIPVTKILGTKYTWYSLGTKTCSLLMGTFDRIHLLFFFYTHHGELRDKKTASLPKRSRKMLMTLTEIGFNYLRLSPRWEQFKPCIMDESPGDHSKTRHDFKPTSKRMDRGTLTAVGNAKRGHYVVVEIEKTHPSVAASTIYGREINEGSRLGQAFQLATKDLKDTWDEVEVKAESVQIGSVVKYVQVGDGFVFQGNTKRPRQLQDADKVLSDLSPVDGAHRGVEDSAPNYSKILAEESCQWDISEEGSRVDKRFQLWTNYLEVFLESILALRCADGLHRGVEDAFPNAYILAEGNYEDCTPKELSRLTKVENEAISVFTKLGKPLNLKLNCVENLTLLIPTTALELSHVEDTEDVADGVFVEVAEPFLISGVDDLSKPPYPSICDGLSPRDEPKEIPVEAEKLEADPEEAASEDGEAF
ncbi:hypothetical protein AWC38_SpisGene8574 [Stylophora pistillata]|uniref:Uncharacterized protein n=1 Tax=Stylophora pistillata TaxID=50429 RepID=A0A2B4SA28_STYPI|nr:hypothetical protein AWC38_SpisGene8574 [Stylophora pistillata]